MKKFVPPPTRFGVAPNAGARPPAPAAGSPQGVKAPVVQPKFAAPPAPPQGKVPGQAAGNLPANPPAPPPAPVNHGAADKSGGALQMMPAPPVNHAQVFLHNGTWKAILGVRKWHRNRFGTWVETTRPQRGLYGRVGRNLLGRGAPRAANAAVRSGSGFAYYPRIHHYFKQVRNVAIGGGNVPRRDLTAVMGLGLTATQYAQATDPTMNHRFEWCHLHGHGGGGADVPNNIVCGSAHCNTEQLFVERMIYTYAGYGISINVGATRHRGSAHMARLIVYEVVLNNQVIFMRAINALRRNAPTSVELMNIEDQLSRAISRAVED